MTATTTPVELVQSLYEAFGRGDIGAILERVAPDCRWVVPGEGYVLAGTYEGPAGAGQFFQRLAETEQITRFEAREFFGCGDGVWVMGAEECTVVATGKPAATEWAMLFRVRGGMVTYFQTFFDTAAYVRAHSAG